MRILIASHEWEAQSPGGAQRSASALARGLARRPGFEVILVSCVRELPSEASVRRWQHPDGYEEVLIRSETDLGFFTWQEPDVAREWIELLTESRPDVVHLHHYFHIGVEVPLLVRQHLPGVPIVMTLHEFLAICLQSGQMMDSLGHLCQRALADACARCVGWPIERIASRREYVAAALANVDLFVTPSHFVRDRYVDWGIGEGSLRVIPNALDLEHREDSRPRRTEGSGLRLAFIGQHTPFKGLDVLLDAVLRLRDSGRHVIDRLEVYGDGSDRFGPEFAARIEALRLREAGVTEFRGRYTQAELPAILDGVDAIVVPSIWWENSPVVIEEALARRVPVICSDIGGMAEKVVDGRDGWHFQAGNAAALADLLDRLSQLESLQLPEMRAPAAVSEVVDLHLDAYVAARESAQARQR